MLGPLWFVCGDVSGIIRYTRAPPRFPLYFRSPLLPKTGLSWLSSTQPCPGQQCSFTRKASSLPTLTVCAAIWSALDSRRPTCVVSSFRDLCAFKVYWPCLPGVILISSDFLMVTGSSILRNFIRSFVLAGAAGKRRGTGDAGVAKRQRNS